MSEDDKIAIAKAVVAELETKGLVLLGVELEQHIKDHLWAQGEQKRNEETAKAVRTGAITIIVGIITAFVLFVGKVVMEVGKHIDLNAVWKAMSGGN